MPRWLRIAFWLDVYVLHPVHRVLSFLHLDTAEYLLTHYTCWHLEKWADAYEEKERG